MDNRIRINIEEKEEMIKALSEQQDTLKELHRNKIIDDETYYNLLDETCGEIYAEEEEEEEEDEYDYIYKVKFLGMGKPQSIYYKEASDTHWTFNLHYDIGNVKVGYIRVRKSSPEYQSAFYNTKSNKVNIKINENINNIFFSQKEYKDV